MTEPTARRLSVLIVEDNLDLGEALEDTIQHLGHDAWLARDGVEARRLLSHPVVYDLALIDLGLPGVDGYEVARRLRLAGLTALLVAVTGCVTRDVPRRCQEAGFDRHLLKPLRLAQVDRLLQEVAARALVAAVR